MNKFDSKAKLILILFAFFIISVFFYFSYSKTYFKSCTGSYFFTLDRDPSFYYLKASIEDQEYLIHIDTGSFQALSLTKQALQKIQNKKDAGVFKWVNIHGNKYCSPKFVIDLVQIGSIKVEGVTTSEENPGLLGKNSLINPDLEPSEAVIERSNHVSGSIGAGFLRKHPYWALDFPRSRFLFIKDFAEFLKETQVPISSYLEIPLDSFSPHFIISIETDFGIKRFLIDTGSDWTLLDLKAANLKNTWITSKNFKIGKTNFGSIKIYSFKLPKTVEHFDGILGMDFLRNRVILLDFEKNRIFMGPREKQVVERRVADHFKLLTQKIDRNAM